MEAREFEIIYFVFCIGKKKQKKEKVKVRENENYRIKR